MSEAARGGEKRLHGIPASRGVCRGKIFILRTAGPTSLARFTITGDELDQQTDRLERALMATREQLLGIQDRVRAEIGTKDASLFDAQLLLLDDPVLLDEVMRFVQREQVNVEYAFATVSQRYLAAFASIGDDYMRERVVDLRDVVDRILHNLVHPEAPAGLADLKDPCILLADDLTPSQTAVLDRRLILGFATDQGSKTSHTAILARSLKLPAVTGLQHAVPQLRSGQYALLDGYNGLLILDPTDQTLFEYGQLTRRHLAIEDRLQDMRDQPAVTLDGTAVTLSANIENTAEVADVQGFGADGVGLFRTEYLFLNHPGTPSEDEQFQVYHQVAAALNPHPVIIRTLDLGGDKVRAQRDLPAETNPFMGWRAIRICLQEPEMFCDQLRAILRASAVGNVKMMYPMISGLEELNQANELVERCKRELRERGLPFDENLEIGVMIEIPAAALIAESLARRVDFFSIGTNDLIQYTLAVDRMNPQIAHLYDPTHPAVLRLIKQTIDTAHAHRIWAGVCGEMAGDPVLAPLLVGLGADELSVAPALVPAVKFMLRRLKRPEAQELAEFAIHSEHSEEILGRCQQLAESIAPSLFATTSLNGNEKPTPSN